MSATRPCNAYNLGCLLFLIFFLSNLCLLLFLLEVNTLDGNRDARGLSFGSVRSSKLLTMSGGLVYFAAAVALVATLILDSGIKLDLGRGATWFLAALVCLGGLIAFFVLKSRMALWLSSVLLSIILMTVFFTNSGAVGFHLSRTLADQLLLSHILISSLGQAFSLLACLLSALFLKQQSNLKHKRLQEFTKGPGLTRLDRLFMLSLRIGLALFSLALFTGALIAQTLELGANFSLGWKTLWALAVWLTYLSLVQGRELGLISARKTAQLTFIGFAVLLSTFFGTLFSLGGN